jgi:hypothetical protein
MLPKYIINIYKYTEPYMFYEPAFLRFGESVLQILQYRPLFGLSKHKNHGKLEAYHLISCIIFSKKTK